MYFLFWAPAGWFQVVNLRCLWLWDKLIGKAYLPSARPMELMVSTAMTTKDRADTVHYRKYSIVTWATNYRITSQNIVPWFQFDSLVLSSRIMMIFAISFVVLAHAIYFISGNWNWVLSGLDEKVKRWLARAASILYFLSGSFLIIVSGLFTDIILRAYVNDSKMGPTHSIGMVQPRVLNPWSGGVGFGRSGADPTALTPLHLFFDAPLRST